MGNRVGGEEGTEVGQGRAAGLPVWSTCSTFCRRMGGEVCVWGRQVERTGGSGEFGLTAVFVSYVVACMSLEGSENGEGGTGRKDTDTQWKCGWNTWSGKQEDAATRGLCY